MKNLKDIKEIYSCFIELRLEDLMKAKNGKELGHNDLSRICELIIEFTDEHFGNVPESFYRMLEEVHAEAHHVLMGKRPTLFPPPFQDGDFVCPSPYSQLRKFIKSFLSTEWAIKAIFKKMVEEQLDEMWPEYKDRWKD